MHRFHRVWLDLDREEFGHLSADRIFTLAERLPAYEGAVAARLYHLQEEAKKRNPSAAAIAAGAQVVDLTTVMNDPDLNDLIEYSTVQA